MHSMIPAPVLEVAAAVSAELKARGVPHVFIGGIAISAYGYERMTRDVDVLVRKRDLEKIDGRPMAISGRTFKVGDVDVDVISPPGRAVLFEELIARHSGEVIPFTGLALLKIMANRQKDLADLVELTKIDISRTRAAVPWLKSQGALTREVFETLQEIILTAELEKGGEGRKRNPAGGGRLMGGGRYRKR